MNYTIDYAVKSLEAITSPLVATSLAKMKALYGDTVKTVSTNSNVDPSLLYSLMFVISNGANLGTYQTADKLIRQGVFGLSQKTAKQILSYEMQQKRMNQAELDYLRSIDPAIASYLSDEKGKKAVNEHWKADTSVRQLVSDTLKPFNLMDPRVSTQIEAIWIGQLLDYYGTQTNKPADKAFITALLPSNGWRDMPLMAGNDFPRTKPFTNDYLGKDFKLLPGSSVFSEGRGSMTDVISPAVVRTGKYGSSSESFQPWIGFALREVFAPGGVIDTYFKSV